ncbi:hypothetical protein S83_052408 [Arachis hypogaea]|uniref:Uncharacterized protein n=1 Tax=Arachis hypogaea TaxID=3818 RepID=A0A444YZR2_ARAHY|nr:hypothetical protein Ahy_B05g074748 isoform A [Arachis hypogaea]
MNFQNCPRLKYHTITVRKPVRSSYSSVSSSLLPPSRSTSCLRRRLRQSTLLLLAVGAADQAVICIPITLEKGS